MPTRIAVLSDLHLDRQAEPGSWDLSVRAFEAAAAADHVIVAGDLFDCAGAMRRERGLVERMLRQLGLWRPERLTLVVGNHDVFEVNHRGGLGNKVAGGLRVLRAGAQASLDAYCAWAGELVQVKDRAFSDTLFPYRRSLDGVTVIAADSTARTTLGSAQGFWDEAQDEGVRRLLRGVRGQRMLAVHNPPELADEAPTLTDRIQGYVGGYPREDFERIERLADEAHLDAVVAGHYHAGAVRWSWGLGRSARVHVVGRTGGLHGETPRLGLLATGRPRAPVWRTRTVD